MNPNTYFMCKLLDLEEELVLPNQIWEHVMATEGENPKYEFVAMTWYSWCFREQRP